MKKVSLFVFLFFLPLFASCGEWGALTDYDDTSASTSPQFPAAQPARPGANYLLKNFLDGKTVRIFLFISNEEKESLPTIRKQQEEDKKYQQAIVALYQSWFSEPAKMIRKQRREQEFSDILPFLEKPVSIQFVNAEKDADIAIYIQSYKRVIEICKGPTACYQLKRGSSIPKIWLSKNKFILTVLTLGKLTLKRSGRHEIGHSLGLSDQYRQARSDNSHAVYRSNKPGKGVMNNASKQNYDDADGIINLIDITRQVRFRCVTIKAGRA